MKSCLKTLKGFFYYILYNYLHYIISNKDENNLTRDQSPFNLFIRLFFFLF